MPAAIDPKIFALAAAVIAEGKNKRAVAVLEIMLDKGEVSTDEIQALGYNHPPRAIGDVRDAGIPIITGQGTSVNSGRRMAVYSFGNSGDIQSGRIGGRSALPKKFKAALIAHYGPIDCITGAVVDERVLQIDHRVPYRIAGDMGLRDHDIGAYMLLDGSSQRAKSWACEHCPNMATSRRETSVCATCYWAFPLSYEHIATQHIRRTDITWQGADVEVHDKLKAIAIKEGRDVSSLLKAAGHQIAKRS